MSNTARLGLNPVAGVVTHRLEPQFPHLMEYLLGTGLISKAVRPYLVLADVCVDRS